MSNSVQPHRWQPTRLHHSWDSPGKNTGVGCYFLLQCMKLKSEIEVTQSCLTLSNPMDCSLPGSSIHGIFQARVLEWGAIAFSIWSHHFMANRWGNSGHSGWLNFSGLQNHSRWWLQPWSWKTFVPWKKSYDKPRCLLKSRDITLPVKIHLFKAMVFPEDVHGCESWIIKKAECQRIAFELWCWRRLLRVPWTARQSNQSNLQEINPEYSLEGLI